MTADNGSPLDPDEQRAAVRTRYAGLAGGDSNCCSESTDCCDTTTADGPAQLGYRTEDVAAIPESAQLSLGCGNPLAIDNLEPGEDVLDLGSGAGFDCFLAATEVGPDGSVIGVDMTPEMLQRARRTADDEDYDNVDFRLGEIEALPVADHSVDVIISNCVINLSPDKPRVFEEAFRVLRPEGRLAVSDVVLTAEPPDALREDADAIASCAGGAESIPRLRSMLETAGFESVAISPKVDSAEFIRDWSDKYDLDDYLRSASIKGRKPT